MINTQQTLDCQIDAIVYFAIGPSSGLSVAELRALAREFHIAEKWIEAEIAKRAGHPSLEGVFG
jgi:hypothetical protein